MTLELTASKTQKPKDGQRRHGGLTTDDIKRFADSSAPRNIPDEQRLAETIRKRLVNARNLNRLEQKDAAKLLGYKNSSALSKIENGVAKIPKGFIIHAAIHYGVSCDYLMGLSDEPERDPKTAEHMAIIRAVKGQILEHTGSLASVLLKNASDMTPMEGHLSILLAQTKRAFDAFETVCVRNKRFQNEVLAGSTLVRAMDELQASTFSAKKFMDHRADLVQARTAAMCEGKSYPLLDDEEKD